jgi:cell division protein FtsQ
METGGNSYLNRAQIESPLKSANKYPAGKKMSEIKVGDIEKTLENNRLIKKAEAYKTIDGRVKICVYQRIPVLRVMHGGEGYYVDNEAQIMPVPAQYAAYVPLATGFIPRDYACEQLYEFAEFLREHKYWNEHIEQINVLPNRDVELIPRKGSHTILLGKIEDYRENLDKLKLFYEKGLSKIGWNKYSQINLKYKNLVICTKRK